MCPSANRSLTDAALILGFSNTPLDIGLAVQAQRAYSVGLPWRTARPGMFEIDIADLAD